MCPKYNWCVHNMSVFVLNMTEFVANQNVIFPILYRMCLYYMTELLLSTSALELNISGFVLNMTGNIQDITAFV